MILSTEISGAADKIGDFKAIEMIAGAGFDAIDYSMFGMKEDDHFLNTPAYEKHIQELLKIARECGVHFNQAHAPFPSYMAGNDAYNATIVDKLKRSVEIAGVLGAKHIIVHPVYRPENKKEFNINLYNSLLPCCKEFNVKIALENMWTTDQKRGCIVPIVCSTGEEFAEYVDALDSEWFAACLDLGHVGIAGLDEAEIIKTLGRRLKALHVHDNDFRGDRHQAPFTGSMDWEKIIGALKEIGYEGDMTFEAISLFKNMPVDLLPAAYKFLHDVGRHLIKMFEQ